MSERSKVPFILAVLVGLMLHSQLTYALTESFESGGFEANWVSFGDVAWEVVTNEGFDGSNSVSVTVPAPRAGQTRSILQTTTIAAEAGTLSFRVRTATNSNEDNRLEFFIDGVRQQGPDSGSGWTGWSGDHEWAEGQYQYSISKGSHILRWEYLGGNINEAGSVWIDAVTGPAEGITIENVISYSDQCRETLNNVWVGNYLGALAGLTKDDFTVTVNGAAVTEFDLLQTPPQDVSTSLVMDYSGSMTDDDKRNVEAVAIGYVKLMDANDRSEVIKFASTVERMIAFTDDKASLYEAISEPPSVVENTALYDALSQGIEGLSSESGNKRAIIAFTDGRDNESISSRDAVISQARQASVSIYTVGLGANVDETDLQFIAESTGGKYFKADVSIDLLSIYNAIKGALSGNYQLVIDNSEYPRAKSRNAQIAVTASQSGEESQTVSVGEGCGMNVLFMSIPSSIVPAQKQ